MAASFLSACCLVGSSIQSTVLMRSASAALRLLIIAKARALEMINNLKAALADRIKTVDWMDEPTKQQALKKLAAMNVKIGYPDKWRDYSLLQIDRGSYVSNAMRAANFEANRDLKKIGKPVDRSEWGMTPPTVNAYYNPMMNE